MKEIPSVREYLKGLDSCWNSSYMYTKAEYQFKFFVPLIKDIIESTSEISDEDKLYVRRFFDMLVGEYWHKLQEEKYSPKPKYSAEHAFDVIRTLNCSLEDKLKIVELFEYMEK
jgi:hypothetical protein